MEATLIRLVWQRAQGRCEYCQMSQEFDHPAFEIDHVTARKHGGATAAGNLALSCFYCNSHKGPNLSGIDPVTGKITPLFHPRRHKWNRHFRWEGAILTGLTASGRTSIGVLCINDSVRIELREELIDEGLFPPA
jgi:hypothetical protein